MTNRPVPNDTQRVYVVELEPGDVLYGTLETVATVERVTDHRTRITMTNGHVSAYSKSDSTVFVTLESQAVKIGREHGRNAAGWWRQDTIGEHATGDVRPTALRTLAGIEDGDPEILDSLPGPDLSGQWADDYSSRDLYAELGNNVDDADDDGSLCDAYDMAFSEAMHDEITRMCREILA